ncbi:MAG: hypothetical protein J2P15_19865, partial [Micromonosporaceae bacterium]|nr:hypothetical protein [Micromonosporaceae bacterium]
TNATGAGGGGPAGRVPVSGLAGDRTGGAQASPAPVRTNATTSSRPKPKPVQRTISTVGGSIVARCVGSTASIVSTSPLTGFAVADLNAGPAKQVGLTFHALVTDVNVVITCSSGVPTPSISVS